MLPGQRRRHQDRATVQPPVNRAIQRLAEREQLRRGLLGGQQQAAMVQVATAAGLQAAQGEPAELAEERQMVPVWPDHPDRPLMAFCKIAKASSRQSWLWWLAWGGLACHPALPRQPSFCSPFLQCLKPHQREGLQFMWNSLVLDFEAVSGACLLPRCCCRRRCRRR